MTIDPGPIERYLCVMFRGLLFFLLVALPAGASCAQSGEVSADHPAEYMIYQYPDVSLVVKIEAPGVPVEARIYGPEDALLKSSGIPSGRIGPLYQFVEAVDTPRQLMIKVSPERSVDRSIISLELIQLPDRDRNSSVLAQAYRLLSFGTELVHSNDTTTWAMKTYTLRNAARAFAGMGWEEMRLWSEFHAAHLVLHKLNDELTAMELAGEVQESARKAGFETIELAALVLEGDALMLAGENSSGPVAAARFEQVHPVLDRVVILAQALGLKSEQAYALYTDGLAYQNQNQPGAAIGQFQKALDVSLTAGNPELVNEIRSTAAATYESMGSTADAIDLLEDIGSDLENDEGQELTDTLFEKGRILNDNFRYREAAVELGQALDIQRSGSTSGGAWGPIGLALAWSHYSMGNLERAAGLILESIPRTPQSQNIDALVQAYNSLANIYRAREDFSQMNFYREKQGVLASSEQQRMEFMFESARDAWSREGPRSRTAREKLTRIRTEAAARGSGQSGQRAEMYLCLLSIEQNGRGSCSAGDVMQSHDALRNSGLPGLALDSDFIMAKILRREGREREAHDVMEGLINEMFLLRQALPGVLGAWFWQTKDAIFEEYMAIALARSGADSGKPVDGKSALLALNHIRVIESSEQAPGDLADTRGDDALRSLLARREAATAGGTGEEALAAQVNQALKTIAGTIDPAVSRLSPAALDKVMAGLSGDETLLTYYLGDAADYVIVGTRRAVSLLKLSGSSPVSVRLLDLRAQIQAGTAEDFWVLPELERIGQALVGPVSDYLAQKIYLLPAGALNGFPFNALRLNGRFLAEKHEVVNVANLSGSTVFHPVLQQDYLDRVFLAGNPQTSQELFSYDVQISPEISAVTDRFVGPGLQVVQGVALSAEEFRDVRFVRAGLIHLAMPGTLDLGSPDRSRLLLSGTGPDAGMEYLTPSDVHSLDFEAGLAVLSRTAVVGSSPSSFDSRLGFVTDFLDAGVSHVVASLWVDADSDPTGFVRDFYTHLEATGDVAEALSLTRMNDLESQDDTNFRSWAGFQLFIR